VNAIYVFKILGEGGGEWTVDCTAQPPTCTRGISPKAQCTVEVQHADFKTMLGDPNAAMQLYFQGKLRVSGDPMLAMKLQQLFEIARPK
jgi:putative sterol carrier protein